MIRVNVLSELDPEMVLDKLRSGQALTLSFQKPDSEEMASVKVRVLSGGLALDGRWVYTVQVPEDAVDIGKPLASLKLEFIAANVGYLSTLEF